MCRAYVEQLENVGGDICRVRLLIALDTVLLATLYLDCLLMTLRPLS